ncbi:MAG: hypothetical protein ACLU6Y_16285 [Ruminococcus sp.]
MEQCEKIYLFQDLDVVLEAKCTRKGFNDFEKLIEEIEAVYCSLSGKNIFFYVSMTKRRL